MTPGPRSRRCYAGHWRCAARSLGRAGGNEPPIARQRHANLWAELAFLRLPPTEPELVLLHRVLDSWSGLGLEHVRCE
jgi:hypothetical protein